MKSNFFVLKLVFWTLIFLTTSHSATGENYQETARKITTLQYRVEAFYTDAKRYPSSVEELKIQFVLRDQWGNQLLYETSPDFQRYVIASPGMNGIYEKPPVTFMYDLPIVNYLRNDDGVHDDFVIANHCDWGFPYGLAHRCSWFDVTMITLRNAKETLQNYFDVFSEYPTNFDPSQLKKNIEKTSKYPYVLSNKDGWNHKLVYYVSPDRKKYILASPGKDGRFAVSLREILRDKTVQILRDETENEDIIIMNGKKVIWPDGFPF